MDFSANKQDTYEKRIASLPDQPNMQPDELKAYFDSSPEQLRQAHNGLCDALTEATCGTSAASGLGFQRTAGVPADNVQAAVENVQAQLTDAVLGNIPSGSVTQDKLAQDVRDRFTSIENAAKSEASTRSSKDSNLQSQIDTHTSQIAAKCEIAYGYYEGNDVSERSFQLGWQPRVVIVARIFEPFHNNFYYYGGIAFDNYPAIIPGHNKKVIQVTATGFTVYHDPTGNAYVYANGSGTNYIYIAIK